MSCSQAVSATVPSNTVLYLRSTQNVPTYELSYQ